MSKHLPFAASRRDFLKTSLALALTSGAGDIVLPRSARAEGFATLNNRVLVNIALDGGPDMRYLFPPAWKAATGSYGRRYWEVRARAHQAIGGASALEARWHKDFFPIAQGGVQFGILRKCGFLKKMWDAGHLALVQNVFGATSRDHAHATQVIEQGNSKAGKNGRGSGWGGRLAVVAGGHAVALSQVARAFTFGPDRFAISNLGRIDKSNVVHIANMRNAGLFHPAPTDWLGAPQYVARSLKNYYAAKAPTLAANSRFYPFIEHERELRTLGKLIDTRLANLPKPQLIEELTYHPYWTNSYLALQARNLYDALACHDIVDLRVASLEFPGWDTHDNQASEIERAAEHIFGSKGVLAALNKSLPANVWSKLVFVMGGEFGRQLLDNGGNGTDHGVGTTQIVLGASVRGGIYGDMFPEEELLRLQDPSPDIKGETAIEQVFGVVCDLVAPGSKGTVFPTIGSTPLEGGSRISELLA